MTKALVNCFVCPQYLPLYIQAIVVFLFTQNISLFTLQHRTMLPCCRRFWALTCTSTPLLLFWHCILNLWSVWRSVWTMCMQISLSHYAGCLCMSAFFTKRYRWRVGRGVEWRCMFLEGDLCTHAPICAPTHLRREKLYLHLHKNNWHFKLAFQSKRILFFSICAGIEPVPCHTREYEREGKREQGWEGTRHKRLTL